MSHTGAELVSRSSAEALELPTVLATLAELTATDGGRRKLLDLRPSTSEAWLHQRRQSYEEAVRLLGEERLVAELEEPLLPLMAKLARVDKAIAGTELLQVAGLLMISRRAADLIEAGAAECPLLGELASSLPQLDELGRKIKKSLDRRGAVRDDASSKLTSLRRQVRTVRDGLYQDLRGSVDRYREHLSEETIPLKDGRLLLVLQAGAKGRVEGLVHGRSGTGRSFYFEPFEVVEANNRLQETLDEEEAERRRILGELAADVRSSLPEIETHLEFVAELDLLQAAWRFAELCDGRLTTIGDRHDLVLKAARHPLLDPRLAELRRAALDQEGHTEPVVPLDLELVGDDRVLVITGPNAGGKTVALKTVGLLALLAQCGLPVPVDAGSRLPVFSRVMAMVGDEQDLLSDRSTFSGRLLRLKEAWQAAEPDSLILLDELGSGTDPEEGAALAIALLEGLVAKEALAVLTTHLTQLAAAALEIEAAACAAMEFDPATDRPTYRLRPGSPGGSEALALAQRLGLPADWIERAEELLGSEHRDLRRLLAEVERVRSQLAGEQLRLEQETAGLAQAREQTEQETMALADERRRLGAKMGHELDAFRRETTERLRGELESMMEQLERGRKRGLVTKSVERLFEEAPPLPEQEPRPEGPLVIGEHARHAGLGWEGRVEKIHKGVAEVSVRGKRVSCPEDELIPVKGGGSVSTPKAPPVRVDRGTGDEVLPVELNLIGWRVEPALEALDSYLDRALLAAHHEVRVVHGFGTGRLRQAVRHHLRPHPAVEGFRGGKANEGGDGATVVILKDG
ncbi:MAG: Smr/MutS family protein [Thermoanaerobaculia bacterium]